MNWNDMGPGMGFGMGFGGMFGLLILVLLSMLGFTSAVSVARMVSDRIASRRRRFTPVKREEHDA